MAKKIILESEAVANVAERLFVEGKILRPQKAKVAYFIVSPSISKRTHARCILASSLLQYYANVDYVIQVGETSWNFLNDTGKEILILHELNHIMEVQNQETGEWTFKIRPHDIQDFAHVIRLFGMDWFDVHVNLENMNETETSGQTDLSGFFIETEETLHSGLDRPDLSYRSLPLNKQPKNLGSDLGAQTIPDNLIQVFNPTDRPNQQLELPFE